VKQSRVTLRSGKDLSVLRARSESGGRLALLDRLGRSDRKVRRGKPVAKAQSDPAANADRQDRRALLARPARPDRRVPRVTPASHWQFASSLVRIAFAAETTKSWLVLFARAVRPTERSARRLARQQPVYVYGGDRGHRVTPSLRGRRFGGRSRSRPADVIGAAVMVAKIATRARSRTPRPQYPESGEGADAR
jgi:hypothetical protein